jgi:hypothetical protein
MSRCLARFLALLALGALSGVAAQVSSTPSTPASDPKELAARIQSEVAEIRGVPFKREVGVAIQQPQDFTHYLDERIDEVVPENIAKHYGKIVRRLGLYRGATIDDFRGMMQQVMTSQAAAYYDPKAQRFYVLMEGGPELMTGVIYAHELYHGLQDQYFGLTNYMKMSGSRSDPSFNSDAQLARQAVVEGEATYIMTLWMLKRMTGSIPGREMLAPMVKMQSELNLDQARALIAQPQVTQMLGEKVTASMEAAKAIPPFIMETMMGAYLKGYAFVFAVQEQGWPAVERLYTGQPPQSSEQILHPEKWLAREAPSTISWPAFDKASALRHWELLDRDVLGEFQWRVIFKEFDMRAEAESLAAGWDGDSYAIFRHRESDDLLLLLRTSWDTENDAKDFAAAYERLLALKYAAAPETTKVERKGVDVFIVEGGSKSELKSLMKIVKQARKAKG